MRSIFLSYQKLLHLARSPELSQYKKSIAWLLTEKVGAMGIAFVVGAVVARYLGPEQLGVLAYSQSLVGFVFIITELGLESLLNRDLVKHPGEANELLGTALVLRIIGSVCGTLLILGIIITSKETPETTFIVLVLSTTYFFRSVGGINSLFQARVQNQHLARVRLAQGLLSAGIKVLLVYLKWPLAWFGVVLAMDHVFTHAGYVAIYQWQGGRMGKWRHSWQRAREMLRDSWPFILSSLAIGVYMQSDQILINHLLGDTDNGHYAVALKLSQVWHFLPSVLITTFYPSIVKAKEKSEALFTQRTEQLLYLILMVGIGIGVVMTLAGPSLVVWIYGPEYAVSGTVLVIHIWTIVAGSIGSVGSNWLLTNNLQRFTFYRTSISALVNVGLNFLLIPHYGIVGAAVATLIAQVNAAYLGHLVSPKTRPMFFLITRVLLLQSLRQRIIHHD